MKHSQRITETAAAALAVTVASKSKSFTPDSAAVWEGTRAARMGQGSMQNPYRTKHDDKYDKWMSWAEGHAFGLRNPHERHGRKKPYTSEGVRRLPCYRCGAPACHVWNACADAVFRPICIDCDIDLNRIVLRWMGCPDAEHKLHIYDIKAREAERAALHKAKP